jgi:hypothetical protein
VPANEQLREDHGAAPKTDWVREVLYLVQSALGFPDRVQVIVEKDNDIVLVWMGRRTINASHVGTRIETQDGGYLERIRDVTWVQWRYVPPPPPPATPPHTASPKSQRRNGAARTQS